MNERIRDLTEQAAGDFTENFKWDYLPEIDKDIFEKFVELIVRECIDTVLDSSVEYTTRPRIAQELKEHFGVEE